MSIMHRAVAVRLFGPAGRSSAADDVPPRPPPPAPGPAGETAEASEGAPDQRARQGTATGTAGTAGTAGATGGGPLSRRAVAFLWLSVGTAAGALVIALSAIAGAYRLPGDPLAVFLGAGLAGIAVVAGLVLAAVIAQHFPITLSPGHKATLAIAVYYADALLLGPVGAVPVVALSSVLGQGTLTLRRESGNGARARGMRAVAFNTAQAVLAAAVGGLVYAVLRPLAATATAAGAASTVPAGPLGLAAAAAAAGAMYLTNTALVATMVALQRGGRPWDVWRAGQRGRLPEVAGQFLVGFFVAWALPREPWLLVPAAAGAAAVSRSLARRTQLARQEAELAKREAEAAALRELTRRKDEFLGTVSHELRTPLSIVCGYADLLLARRTGLDATAAHMVDSMLTSAMQLSRMVDDLLEFARVERGSLALRLEATDLTRVVAQTLTGLERHEGAERIRVELPEQLPVYADSTRVAQALTNLITNALKYAPDGPVVVRAYHPAPSAAAVSAGGAAGQAGALPPVRVEVEDFGPGIPEGEQVLVWDTFFRGSGANRRGAPRGTGIGLAVVKAVIEAQGGRVGLSSAAGQGSRFWFELPALPPTLPPAPAGVPAGALPTSAMPAAAGVPIGLP